MMVKVVKFIVMVRLYEMKVMMRILLEYFDSRMLFSFRTSFTGGVRIMSVIVIYGVDVYSSCVELI